MNTVKQPMYQWKCAHCELYFKPEDKLEVDHLIPKSNGGKDLYLNWQLLHVHCHHQKSAEEEKLRRLEVQMKTAKRARNRMRENVMFTIFVGWPVHSTSYGFTFASLEICFWYDVK